MATQHNKCLFNHKRKHASTTAQAQGPGTTLTELQHTCEASLKHMHIPVLQVQRQSPTVTLGVSEDDGTSTTAIACDQILHMHISRYRIR
jgi:hypothetical protein